MSIVRADNRINDEALKSEILRLIEMGFSEAAAVGSAGLHKATYAKWISKGYNDPEAVGPFGKFYLAVEQAKAMAERITTGKILASNDWRAAAWIAEHRDESWSEKRRVMVENVPSPEDISALRQLPVADLEKMLASGNANALQEAKIIEYDAD